MRAVQVVGGGPAGAMAAFAAMREGAPVRIFEKSAFPRHKVCGEFLSPAILPLLRRAGCEAGFLQLRPAVLSAMRLHFGTRVVTAQYGKPRSRGAAVPHAESWRSGCLAESRLRRLHERCPPGGPATQDLFAAGNPAG